jgi:hypothetical protein
MRRTVVTMMMPDRFRSIILGQLLYLLQLNCTSKQEEGHGEGFHKTQENFL